MLNGNYSRKNRITVSVNTGESVEEENTTDLTDEKVAADIAKAQQAGDSVALINTMLEAEPDTVTIGMNTMVRLMRTDMIQMEFSSNRTFAEAFLYLLLGIAVFIILVITKKRIDDERLQIGVLKSLGYKRYQIAMSYLVYPFVGAIIGGLLGYLIGILLHGPITNIFLSFYTVPLAGFKLNSKYLINSILVPMGLLSLLSFLIAFFMLRKKPLALLKEGSNLKVNFLSKLTTKMTKLLPFESKFRYQLASRSIGKLLIVTLTSFCTGLLIILIIIGSNLFNSMIDKTFDMMKYKYMIYYNTPQTVES
ncbi:MAG: FtsX-like permease family protein, partial [Bacilli bacterium]|nr:FtsX-like permease family protein [Bacilli bacterium]